MFDEVKKIDNCINRVSSVHHMNPCNGKIILVDILISFILPVFVLPRLHEFMANLFLYYDYYESSYVKKVKNKDLFVARKFRHTVRFIDDLLAINDDGEFEKCFRDIYPEELELKKEHGGNSLAFLELSISIKGRTFETSLYDKRDNFPFSIVRMPFKSSNIPSKIFYSTLGAEVLRIGRASSNTDDFIRSAKIVIHRMKNQGVDQRNVTRVLKIAYGRHDALKKINANVVEFVKSLQ